MNFSNELLATIDGPALVDWVLGWSLRLPRELTLLIVVLLTVGLFLLVRRWATPQDRLARCANDLVRLRELRRAARQSNDQVAIDRIRRTTAQLKLIQLKADLVVLAWVLAPLGLLAWWASARLEFHPPRVGDELVFTARYPVSSLDRVTFLVPPADWELFTPSLQRVATGDAEQAQPHATWRLRPTVPNSEDVVLRVRHRGATAEHRVRIGDWRYLPPEIKHLENPIEITAIALREFRFLEIVPGVPALGLAPWMVAYLGLSLVLMPVAKRLTHIS